jgi:hypothetical protein
VTSDATTEPSAPAGRYRAPRERLLFDPFVVPATSPPLADVRARDRVAVAGRAAAMACAPWDGGPTLEVTVDDGTGTLVLALVGRQRLAGIEIGRELVAGGTIVRHRGRSILMNPNLWLRAG